MIHICRTIMDMYHRYGGEKMIPRLIKLPEDESFFLFGPRGSGKTTIMKHLPWYDHSFYINLLLSKEERDYSRNPDRLVNIVEGLPDETTHVIIDEVQKIPKLLDLVHNLIETTNKKFILTGSSARKLKHGGANLLAGRAFVYHLAPFTFLEVDEQFSLNDYLRWGTLPKIFEFNTEEKKILFLDAYANTYLKEEVWNEQIIRVLEPFRYFLEVAAQSNGKIVNYTKIAKDVGVDVKTIQNYFTILEDTLLGFFLAPFQHSFRKRLSKSPKFYFFDPGVVKALANQLTIPLNESTNYYGDCFEHFVITQCKYLSAYFHRDYRFSYLKTKDDAEIDLVVERPNKPLLFIEIKSSKDVEERHLRTLKSLSHDFGECEAICFSRDDYRKKIDGITIYPWAVGIKKFFGPTE